MEAHLNDLTEVHRTDLVQLINSHLSLFSDTPSCTNLVQRDIDMGDSRPIKERFVRMPVEKEVEYMRASPWLLVPKSDGTDRFCT